MCSKEYQDSCFQVTGMCSDFTLPEYAISVEEIDHNITHIRGSGATFCLKNITEQSTVTERCNYVPQNSFCQSTSGELVFLSRTELDICDNQQRQTAGIFTRSRRLSTTATKFSPSSTTHQVSMTVTVSSVYSTGAETTLSHEVNHKLFWIAGTEPCT